jgi:hypothetical protein
MCRAGTLGWLLVADAEMPMSDTQSSQKASVGRTTVKQRAAEPLPNRESEDLGPSELRLMNDESR